MKKRRIILASTSPRRRELLEQIGIDFEIVPSVYEEDMTLVMSNAKLVQHLAYGKANDVAQKFKDAVVIGSDTFVVFHKKRLGKPKDQKQAEEMLRTISDGWVTIYTGLAIIDAQSCTESTSYEKTKVKIKKLSEKEIKAYVAMGEPCDKAGAFAIQGKGAVFIEKISGCHTNVIGLPLHRLYMELEKIGVDIWAR